MKPAHAAPPVVGFWWSGVLTNLLAGVDSVDAVLARSGGSLASSTPAAPAATAYASSYTYHLTAGGIASLSPGDVHEPTYAGLAQAAAVSVGGDGFVLTLYPTAAGRKLFTSSTPATTTGGVVAVIAALALVFAAFDAAVRSATSYAGARHRSWSLPPLLRANLCSLRSL